MGKLIYTSDGEVDLDKEVFQVSENHDLNLINNNQQLNKINTKLDRQIFINRKINGLTSDSESGHFSTFPHTALYDGIMTMNNSNSAWLNNNNTRPWVKSSMPCIVVIGDSVAEGHPNTHGRLHQSDGSVDLNYLNVAGQLSFHIEQFTKLKTFNHGIGSQTSTNVLTRWNRDVLGETVETLTPTSTLTKKPTCVIIVVGINDIFGGKTIDEITTNIDFMITSSIENNIVPIVFNIGTHNLMDIDKLKVVKGVNKWLEDKEKITQELSVIDFYNYSNDINNDGKPKTGYTVDGVHPTKYHYERLARKIIDECFTEQKIPIIPRYINFSSAFDFTNYSANILRPNLILLSINDIPTKYYLLPNTPDQCIPIPFTNSFIESIKVQILSAEKAYESEGTGAYIGFAEMYLTDKNIFSEKESPVYESDRGSIVKLPSDSVGIAGFRCAIPSDITAGNVTFANTSNMTNVIGIFVENTTTDGYVCTQGICLINVAEQVYKGDLLVTSGTNGQCTRATNPTVGAIVAEVLIGASANSFAVCRRR